LRPGDLVVAAENACLLDSGDWLQGALDLPAHSVLTTAFAFMVTPPIEAQAALFELPPHQLEPASANAEHVELAQALPASIALGAMTWTYPGWKGIVYGRGVSDKQLAAHGLTAYAKHPLLRCAEIDRTYYEPLPVDAFAAYAAQVPDDFRFFVKAHEDCTVLRFPTHARYGKKRGQDNPHFLDVAYAKTAVIAPLLAGLGHKLGGILFQFPPQDVGDPRAFAHRLRRFLESLPKGPVYAVELRNPELLTPDYVAALAATGAIHCHNAWTVMPSVLAQIRRIPPAARRPLLIRWLLRRDDSFEEAQARYAPFDRLVCEDLETRGMIASLVAKAHAHGVPVFVLVDNKAEGCAPESIVRLARAIVVPLAAEPAR
jgi:uncharacterized protein YecE (DUF72 family)